MARTGKNARGRDMVLSMAVLLIPVLLIMAFFARPGSEEPQAVDYQRVLTQAKEQAPYEVLAPSATPNGWVPTRVRWAKPGEPWLDGQPSSGHSWQLGFLNPKQVYIAIQQRDGQPAVFIQQVTREGKPEAGTVEAAGLTWERYLSADGRTRSLVSTTNKVTSIISGDVLYSELEEFAKKLK